MVRFMTSVTRNITLNRRATGDLEGVWGGGGLQPMRRYYGIYLDVPKKTTKYPVQDSRLPGRV
jgi:hypothetical protein